MAKPILAETIGFELEVEKIYRQRLNNLPSGFQQTGDASVESDALLINGIPVVLHGETKGLKFSSGVIGTEILSSVINTNKPYLGILKELCNTLLSLGEPEQSKRAGIHVHVSFIYNLRILKAALELGAYLEDVFFLLGGMGYEFRGIENDATYCRPITEFGPPVVNDDEENLYPCFVLADVLKSDNMDMFRTRLGDLKRLHGNRYIPVRYVWLNLYNIYSPQCTLEFRNWNKSLDPLAIQMAIEVCKSFAQLAISRAYAKSEPLPVNSIYHKRSKGEIIETFLSFANEVGLDSHLLSVAMDLLDRTPLSGLDLPEQYTYSHLRFHSQGRKDPVHWSRSSYRPSIYLEADEVRIPEFLDIHNLRRLTREEIEPYIDRDRPRLGGGFTYSGLPLQTTRVRADQTLEIPDWIFNYEPLELEEI